MNRRALPLLVISTVLTGLMLMGFAPVNAQQIKSPPQSLIKEAKSEGTVAWDGPYSPNQMASVIKKFEKTYPGVRIKFSDVKPGAKNTTYQTQEAAGHVSTDVSTAAGGNTFPQFVKFKLDQQGVDWSQLNIPTSMVFNGSFVHLFSLSDAVIYNKNKVSKSQVPQTWDDLLKPQWKGKLAVDGRGGFLLGYYLDPSLGANAGLDYAKKLAAQQPSYQTNLEEVIPLVASGQFLAGTAAINQVLYAQSQHKPIAIAPIGPSSATNIYGFILRNAPHPAAAKLLVSWLASSAGQKALNATYSSAYPLNTACPARAGTQAAAMCANHIKWFGTNTLQSYQAEIPYSASIQKIFGTYTGA